MTTRFVVNSVPGSSPHRKRPYLASRAEPKQSSTSTPACPLGAPAVRARNPSARHMEEESNGSNDHGGLDRRGVCSRVVCVPVVRGGSEGCPGQGGGTGPESAGREGSCAQGGDAL